MVFNNKSGEKVFVSWSGGKDAYLSLLIAKDRGLAVESLLSFVGGDGYSRSHGLRTQMLEAQAAAMNLNLETKEVTWESYEQGFEEAVNRLRNQQGVTGGVFGDVNLAGHREWVEKMTGRCGINYNLPLWMMEERSVSEELVKRGGRALIVAVRTDLVDEEWLGRVIDEGYINYCLEKGISPCGESGEAHTLVVDGPLFESPLRYSLGELKHKENRALIEVLPA